LSTGYSRCHDKFDYFLFIVTTHGLIGRIVGYFMPIYFKELGLTGIQIGTYFAISSIAAIIFSLPMGVSTDRKRVAAIFMVSFF
jgi:MFS family permease